MFRSPNGHVFLTTNHGTLRLGRSAFTRALWDLGVAASLATGGVVEAAWAADGQRSGVAKACSAASRYSSPVIQPKRAVFSR